MRIYVLLSIEYGLKAKQTVCLWGHGTGRVKQAKAAESGHAGFKQDLET